MKDYIENKIAWAMAAVVVFSPITLALLLSDYLISLL